MCQVDGVRHILFCLVGGITEHHALIAGACVKIVVLLTLLRLKGLVYAHSDIGRLLINCYKYSAGIAVESVLRFGISNLLYGITHDFLHINIRIGGDFTCYQHESCTNCGLTCHTAHGVFLHAGIQDGVGDGIADFVVMAFCYGF